MILARIPVARSLTGVSQAQGVYNPIRTVRSSRIRSDLVPRYRLGGLDEDRGALLTPEKRVFTLVCPDMCERAVWTAVLGTDDDIS